MLMAIIGGMGEGKNVLMVYLATKSKREVYSNFKIHIPNYKPLKITDLLDLKNNIDVFIDEGYTWLESRTSGSVLNRYLSYIVLQARKRLIDIIISAQMFSSLDVRFREQCDVVVKCQKIKKGKVIKGFKYSFLFVEKNKVRTYFLKYKDAKKLFDIYDTYEIIESHVKDALILKLKETESPEEFWDEIVNISKAIKKDVKKLTHPRVLNALAKNGFQSTYESQVYAYLQDLNIES